MNIEKELDDADALITARMYSQALKKYNHILQYDKDSDETYLMRGVLLGRMGQIDNAVDDINKSIALNATNSSPYIALAYLYEKTENVTKAIEVCKQACQLESDNAEAASLLLRLYIKQGTEHLLNSQLDQAESYFRLVLKERPNDPGVLYKLTLVLRGKGRIEACVNTAEKILLIDPSHVRAKCIIASSYELLGNIDKADSLITELFSKHREHAMVNIIYAQYALRTNKQEEAISALTDILQRTDVNREDIISINMLLGKLYDSVKNYKKAFVYYKQGNRMLDNNYNSADYQNYVSSLINCYSREKFLSIPFSDNKADDLVFIVGMPRSGTSLVEQIVSAHSDVFGAGELLHVNDIINSIQAVGGYSEPYPFCIGKLDIETVNKLAGRLVSDMRKENAGNKEKITDKLPTNFHNIGLLYKLLPNAKFINCMRDPRDTCLSIYFQQFAGYHPYANNLRSLGIHYIEYQRLMSHWVNGLGIPVHTISYENIVTDTRNEVEKLLEFLSLEWDEECMKFYEQQRTVATASHDQVRQNIYKRSLERWKNYEDDISELLDTLGHHF